MASAAGGGRADDRVATTRVWALNGLLGTGAIVLYVTVVRQLTLATPGLVLPWVVLAAFICLGEGWRVAIHFQRNAHSLSLSELPLVLGMFFVSPGALVSARVAGGVVALVLIRRSMPIKVAFNVALHALEAEVALCLLSVLDPGRNPLAAASWPVVVSIVLVTALIGFSLTALVISIAEGGLTRTQLVRGYVLSVVTAMLNACLAIEAAAALTRNLAELALLVFPILGVAGSYVLYTSEYQKRQRIQHLYECSDLLQRSSTADTALPELLAQIAQVFRSEMAEVVMLPVATGTTRAATTTLREGQVRCREQDVDRVFLESLMMAVGSEVRTLTCDRSAGGETVRAWLAERDLRNVMLTSLWGDGTLLGVLWVGNRSNAVSAFDHDDLALFETFGAQTSVAVQNMRLDHSLTYQAFHDPLTNLANRVLFTDRLEHALSRRDLHGVLAVLFVDLDDFKMVNDTFGHSAGDDLLRSVAERLRSVLRPADTAARLGGDEFAILLEDAESRDDIVAVAERIVGALRPHFVVECQQVAVHASIGIAIGGAQLSAAEMLRRSDAAMYWAKLQGKGGHQLYDDGMGDSSGRRLQVRTELERALEDGDLRVHYQPIVEMASGRIHGVEALVRWEHPQRGWILPSEFIWVAEETGLIDELGEFVLREACGQVQRWEELAELGKRFQVHVNVSPRQLRNSRFVETVRSILGHTRLSPRRLVVEMTETFIGEHGEMARQRMGELKALRVDLAIDDFGTGYSSLSTLKDLPFDILKVDRTFITDINADTRRRAFTQAIVGLGTTLGLTMVAEGVEQEEQRRTLLQLGCPYAQGFLFAKVMPAAGITDLLTAPATPGLRVLGNPGTDAVRLPA